MGWESLACYNRPWIPTGKAQFFTLIPFYMGWAFARCCVDKLLHTSKF